MRTYRLAFLRRAAKEWNGLDRSVRDQFERKLGERLVQPHVPHDRLRRYPACYRIKIKRPGFRLIYRVEDDRLLVMVLKVAPRDTVYRDLGDRLGERG